MARLARFRIFPRWQNALLALLAGGLYILAFPDFEWWWTAWFALVPLMWAVEREGKAMPSFMLGWLFGITCFFGTVWWLTHAPIHYAQVPAGLAYFLIFVACVITGLFPALFAAILSRLLGRFGSWAFLAAPFVWVFTEFARYWLTGNDWNAIGYSQAFGGWGTKTAQIGGVLLTSFLVVLPGSLLGILLVGRKNYFEDPKKAPYFGLFAYFFAGIFAFADPRFREQMSRKPGVDVRLPIIAIVFLVLLAPLASLLIFISPPFFKNTNFAATVVAVQPDVPMSGLSAGQYEGLRGKHSELAKMAGMPNVDEIANKQSRLDPSEPVDYYRDYYRAKLGSLPRLVVFPESPMNFAYDDDRELQQYVREFTTKNNVSLLFNSAEPDRETGKYFNSAVMVGPDGKKVAEYDKIYLLPFGEAVPFPFEGLMPAVVGSFAYGKNYSLVPVGDAKAGVMICFESHFGSLSREYVKEGADVIIEMTNDGYLGPTPVLRQHLANAVFRAVETNRPVIRVTNVGVTAYITETGQVLDAAQTYQEATRVWSVSKSDGSQTFYVKYGDWFAWLCTVVTIGLFALTFRRKPEVAEARA